MFFSIVAAHNLIFEGANVSNVYHYELIDVLIITEHLINSSQQTEKLDNSCILEISLHGACQEYLLLKIGHCNDLQTWTLPLSCLKAVYVLNAAVFPLFYFL